LTVLGLLTAGVAGSLIFPGEAEPGDAKKTDG
jgi:hypothetical protein